MSSNYPIRPQTPQALLHRLPDKRSDASTKPKKYIILISAPTTVAGKVQIARSVSNALSCPLFQGDSLHETSAKAASVGASRRPPEIDGYVDQNTPLSESGPNEARYQRMWLSKMTRTGLLFPEESTAANNSAGFSGFGGASSTSMSRRGSGSSIASASSSSEAGTTTSMSSMESSFMFSGPPTTKYVNKPSMFTVSAKEELRKSNPALMVITHPGLEQWHRDSIRQAVGDYGIGVIFVPLYLDEDDDLPVLKTLDPRTMASFDSLGAVVAAKNQDSGSKLDDEIVLRIDIEATIEDLIEDIVDGVREIMNV